MSYSLFEEEQTLEDDYNLDGTEDLNQNSINSNSKKNGKKKNVSLLSQEEICRYMDTIRHGTPAEADHAKEELILKNEPLIKYIIRTVYASFASMYWADLISHGYLGILTALKEYDPEKSQFSTYVVPYIKHELTECISQMAHNTSPHYTTMIKKIKQATAKLAQYGINDPTPEDIMHECNLGFGAIATVRQIIAANKAMSIDNESVGELAAEEYTSPEEMAEKSELQRLFYEALCDLPELERSILEADLEAYGQKPLTESQLAKRLHITVSDVHRYRAIAYRTLRANPHLRSYYQQEYDEQCKEDLLLEDCIPLVISDPLIESEMQNISMIPLAASF